MNETDNVVPIQARPDRLTRILLWQKLRPELMRLSRDFLATVMQGLFDTADDALFKLAEQSPDGLDRNVYFDSMRLLRLNRREMETQFFAFLTEAFERDYSDATVVSVASDIRYEELSLVSESDLEIDLAAENLAHKIRNQSQGELAAAEKRFDWLCSRDSTDAEQHSHRAYPFSAETLVEGFVQGIRHLDLSLEIRLVILKLFDMQCVNQLGHLFTEINHYFVQHDVLPVLKLGRQSATPRSAAAKAKSLAPDWNQLQQLLGAQRAQQGSNASHSSPVAMGHQGDNAEPKPAQVVSSAEVLHSLNELQQGAFDEVPQGGAHAVGNYLRVHLQGDESSSRPINPVDNDLIDIVCLIFEYILEDSQVPAVARASIGRLQIPMLKVALIDKRFFSMNGHPARNLLNLLARTAMGIDEGEGLAHPYLNKINSIVEDIIYEFSEDMSLFDRLSNELQDFIQQQEQLAEQLPEELVVEQEQKEQQALARSWVKETLSQHLIGREIPLPVLEIVLGPWKDVMLQSYLHEGEHSELWQNQIRFIDVLCWSVEPKQDRMDRSKLAAILVQLLNTLRQGLVSIGYEQQAIDDIFATLEPYHLASLQGQVTPVRQVVDSDRDISAEHSEPRLTDPELVGEDRVILEDIVLQDWESPDPAVVIDDEYLELARHLEMGKWVEFKNSNGRVRRAKLAWKSELLGEFTFLNWKFDVVADRSLHELAADLREGQATILDEVPLMDRALATVVSNLIPKSGST